MSYIKQMNDAGQTICLCMLIKNEHHVLRRSLDSVRALIYLDHRRHRLYRRYPTQLIRDYFHDLHGELYEGPWVNFGHNRSESVAYAKGRADYLLLMEADEFLDSIPASPCPSSPRTPTTSACTPPASTHPLLARPHDEAIRVADSLLANPALTAERAEHLHRNRNFSLQALGISVPLPRLAANLAPQL